MYSVRAILAILDVIKGLDIKKSVEKHMLTTEILQETAEKLEDQGLLKIDKEIHASSKQKMDLIYLALKLGASLKDVSKTLNWRDFEEITSHVFLENNYEVKTRLRLPKRREIDLLAWKMKRFFAVDCKHWLTPMYPSVLRIIVEKQIDRSKLLIDQFEEEIEVYPLIVTLLRWREKSFLRVPIVPINSLNDFLLKFEGIKGNFLVIRKTI